MFSTAMSTKKSQSIILHTWNDYEFKLFVPADKDSKPYVHFNFLNPDTNKNERIRKFDTLEKGSDLKTLKKKATQLINDFVTLLDKGWNPISNKFDDSPLTPLSPIVECLDRWMKHNKEKLDNEAITEKRYSSTKYITSFFKEWLKAKGALHKRPVVFNKLDIENFLHTTAANRKWGKVSFNHYRTDLGTFFNYLVTLKILHDNPVNHTEKKNIRNDTSRFKIFDEEELRLVVTKLANDDQFFPLYVASNLIYYYNIRPIEIIRIQAYNIDFSKNLLVLEGCKTKNRNEARWQLNERMSELFKRLIGNAPTDHYVFAGRNKTSPVMAAKDLLLQRWVIFKKKYKLPAHLKLYALKHTSNYFDLQDGASFEEIRQRNRHANLQVTTLYIKERLFKDVIKPSSAERF